MKIRTRYTWFKVIIALAIVTFLLSLYDIFGNDSSWFVYVMFVYIALAIVALILYIGHKPRLDGEPSTEPELVPTPVTPDAVTEVQGLDVKGPHHFRCPFCSNIFALELTHLSKKHDLRMACPFCANNIRVPTRPKLAAGIPVGMESAGPEEKAVFVCANCGEVLRYTAPGQRAGDRARVFTCPHCGSDRVDSAVGAAA